MESERHITLGDWLDLRDEMGAAEALLENVEIAPVDLTTYWSLSADLLALLQEIDEHLEEWRQHGPGATEPESQLYLAMQHRLRAVLVKAVEIGIEVDDEDED